ncbi:uncharacterized [Tachysurus ichikawai]
MALWIDCLFLIRQSASPHPKRRGVGWMWFFIRDPSQPTVGPSADDAATRDAFHTLAALHACSLGLVCAHPPTYVASSPPQLVQPCTMYPRSTNATPLHGPAQTVPGPGLNCSTAAEVIAKDWKGRGRQG